MLRGTYGVIPKLDDGKIEAKRVYKAKKKYTDKNIQADSELIFCPECKRVYEYIRNNKTKRTIAVYYEDFPSFGKMKLVCPECKVKNVLE